jgi:geranylgeranyl reductase family protein
MYDLIIAGAGPGGCTAATVAARAGLRVLILDKEQFPRDKICGDAISGKSVDVLKNLDLLDRVTEADGIIAWGATFSSPAGVEVSIPFCDSLNRALPPGFVCARVTFDEILVRAAIEAGAELREGIRVTGLVREGRTVTGVTTVDENGTEETLSAPIVIGADGAYSSVVRALGMDQLDEKHYVAGLRAYYRNVTGFHENNYIELHFHEDIVPGYFWIFPMADGGANVGVGMLSSAIKKRGINLRETMEKLIQHPRFAPRFADAEKIGPTKGWGLPLGSKPRPLTGDGWMLIGDAGSLIDPFTGEGIGNAMVSGMKAAEWSIRAHKAGSPTEAFLSGYEKELLTFLKSELRLSHNLQRLLNWKWLLNKVILKASRSPEVSHAISCMFDDMNEREKLVSPLFYIRLLFA